MNIGRSGYWLYENKELNIRVLTPGTILAIERGKYVVTLPHICPGMTHNVEPERMYIIYRKNS